MKFQQKPTGEIELQLPEQVLLIPRNCSEVAIARELLTGFRLSQIPEELAIRPTVSGPEEERRECAYALFSFSDGIAWAQVETTDLRCAAAPATHESPPLAALRQAIRERHAFLGDVDEDHFYQDERGSTLQYLVTIPQDLQVEQAIAIIENVIEELERRRDQILGAGTRAAPG